MGYHQLDLNTSGKQCLNAADADVMVGKYDSRYGGEIHELFFKKVFGRDMSLLISLFLADHRSDLAKSSVRRSEVGHGLAGKYVRRILRAIPNSVNNPSASAPKIKRRINSKPTRPPDRIDNTIPSIENHCNGMMEKPVIRSKLRRIRL